MGYGGATKQPRTFRSTSLCGSGSRRRIRDGHRLFYSCAAYLASVSLQRCHSSAVGFAISEPWLRLVVAINRGTFRRGNGEKITWSGPEHAKNASACSQSRIELVKWAHYKISHRGSEWWIRRISGTLVKNSLLILDQGDCCTLRDVCASMRWRMELSQTPTRGPRYSKSYIVCLRERFYLTGTVYCT